MTGNDLQGAPHAHRPRRRRLAISMFVLAALICALSLTISFNAYGRNISGTVSCAGDQPVVGVFVQAQRLPRLWHNGLELNSGFAQTTSVVDAKTTKVSVTYRFWARFGGPVSIHVGCGGTSQTWSSDNWSPYYGGSDILNIACNPPAITTGSTVTTRDRCTRIS